MVRSADHLVLFDEVQYTRRDWRNRNLVLGPSGPKWLTIPVQVSGNYEARIGEIKCVDKTWTRSHLSTLESFYRKYEPFEELRYQLQGIYSELSELEMLSDINCRMLEWLFSLLRIDCGISVTLTNETALRKSQRLLQICNGLGATEYVSGPSARSYLQEKVFHESKINIRWIDYRLLPKRQDVEWQGLEFSILHLLLSIGVEETIRMSTFGADKTPLPEEGES